MLENSSAKPSNIFILTRSYKWLLNVLLTGTPTLGLIYLMQFQGTELRYKDYWFHEVAITASVILGGFVSYVTWRCYLSSGERFLRWLTAGLMGFTFVYAPHGFLTRFADQNMWLFLLYGPASRLVMTTCFIVGLFLYGKEADTVNKSDAKAFLFKCMASFLVIDAIVATIASSPYAAQPWVRMSMEIPALALSFFAVIIILVRKIKSPLMVIYAISLACFAQTSLAFLSAKVWTHSWWYAHIIFVGGFLFLSYGIIQAFHTTRAFVSVYSAEEMFNRLREEKVKVEASNLKNEGLIVELEQKISEVTTLSGLLPICSACKKIRDDKGYWNQLEKYIMEHADVLFTHGLCPDCVEDVFGSDIANQLREKSQKKNS